MTRDGDEASTDPQQVVVACLERAVAAGIPGVSLAFASEAGLIRTATAGHSNVGTGEPMRADHGLGIGSITKTFVAVVLLQLHAEGRLSIDAKAAEILPASILDGIPNAAEATLAQLMAHTGGVPSWEDDPDWIRAGRGVRLDPDRLWGKTGPLDYVRGPTHHALNALGRGHAYANTNYTLLGFAIEAATGEPAERAIRHRIIEPLGLGHTFLEGFEPQAGGLLACRYHYATDQYRATAGLNDRFPEVRPGLIDVTASNLSVEWTAGGLVSTASDLVAFGRALRDGRLIGAAEASRMAPFFEVPAKSEETDKHAVGLGLFRHVIEGVGPVLGHGGAVLGSTASLWWSSDPDLVLAVVSNVGTMHSGPGLASAGTVAVDSDLVGAALALVGREATG